MYLPRFFLFLFMIPKKHGFAILKIALGKQISLLLTNKDTLKESEILIRTLFLVNFSKEIKSYFKPRIYVLTIC